MKSFINNISILVCIGLFGFSATLRAQTDTSHGPWKHVLVTGLNLSQVGFTHWQKGGTKSLSFVAGVNGKSVREEPTTSWATTYKFAFGETKLGDADMRKTDDEINLESVLSYKLDPQWMPYASASLLTQFYAGYDYPDSGAPVQVSDFFDPATFKEAAGINYLITKGVQTRLGAALREIITNHYPRYAIDPEDDIQRKTRITGGLESVSEVALALDDNVLFRAKIELFAPFKTMDRIVLHSEGSIVAKVSKVFSTEFNAVFINEPDISPYTQIKEGLSIGIVYSIL